MKICFLMDSVYALGGAQKCTIDVANELSKNNDITLLCTVDIPKEKRVIHKINSKIKIKTIKWHTTLNSILNIWTKVFIKINQNTNLIKSKKILNFIYYKKNWNIKKIQNYIDENNFDVVIGVAATHTMILSQLKKRNKKFIGWQHSNTRRYFKMEKQFLWHQEKIFKEALNKIDYYVVLTENDRELIKDYFDYNAICIPNPCCIVEDRINFDRQKIILSVGRYDKVKGYDLLIKAFKKFVDANSQYKYKLYIVGDGPEKEKLNTLIHDFNLQDKVVLTGLTSNVVPYYLKSEFLVLSSRQEGFPMVFLEAMECGLPIVTFDLPCVHEIVNDKFSYIAKYLDVEDLANGMLKMVTSDLRKMRKEAKNRAKDFEIKKIIKRWERLLIEKEV